MKTKYVLVDCENVQSPTLSLLKGEQFRVWMFIGPTNSKIKTELALAMLELRERLVPIRMKTSGKDALDFHIAYYLGKLVKEDTEGCFYIVSRDKGYDPLIQHLHAQHISIDRVKSIEAMLGLQSKKKPGASSDSTDENRLLQKFIATLQKRKTSKPGTLKALRSTIHSDCGKDIPDHIIDSVYNAFLKTSHVQVHGTRLLYPDPQEFGGTRGRSLS